MIGGTRVRKQLTVLIVEVNLTAELIPAVAAAFAIPPGSDK